MASSIVAVGDELLGGFTLDTNSHWLAGRLRQLGHPLKRITVVRDRESEIIAQLKIEFTDREITDVFCCGGLGPTPDDRTHRAVAQFLNRDLVDWEPAVVRVRERVRQAYAAGRLDSPEPNAGNLRMAQIPDQPDHVFRNRLGGAAPTMYRLGRSTRLFVLPGVPIELKNVFEDEIESEFLGNGSTPHVEEIRFSGLAESRLYPLMVEMESTYPDVSIGSYPNTESR
ncbi:MAG TPA: molybdopterin-binding protein, partial [Candidatus Dormibacteraeota bacterium]|nr:molybdopterin-binding protein [Candidatus Dormibacteraeota bacterium]